MSLFSFGILENEDGKDEKMKFIHLSDLHLGKRIYEFSMLEDQKYILKQILHIIDEENPDGVILAGDLYDKSIPPAEAVLLCDWFLTELAGRDKTVLSISGNHDSAERLSFGAGLMSGRKVHFSPVYDGRIKKVSLEDEYGTVDVWLMPFVKPAVVRHAHKEEEEKIETYQEAVDGVIRRMEIDAGHRNVIVAHQFVTGALKCESEEVSVGGLDQISAATFDAFDYAALGHIHSPQKIGRETVRYCGTPLKYSFSEAGQEKSVTIVELKEKGNVTIGTACLKPLRDMRKLKGTYMELMDRSSYEEENRTDYMHITLTDEEDIPDGVQRLRTVYPNLMQLEYDNCRTRMNQEITGSNEGEQKSEMELFQEFFEKQNNQPMGEEQELFVRELIETLKDRRNES